MKPGDLVTFKLYGFTTTGIIVDDCFRQTDERCTMLVKLENQPETEIEVDTADIQPIPKEQ